MYQVSFGCLRSLLTHSLRCGHTFCGLCILQWLKQVSFDYVLGLFWLFIRSLLTLLRRSCHTFCGLCILQWLKQGKRTCPQCRAAIPPHEKPNRVVTCDKIIEGLRPTLTPDQIQNLDERIAESKKMQEPQAATAPSSATGGRGGRGHASHIIYDDGDNNSNILVKL